MLRPPPMARQNLARFRYRLLLSFPQAVLIRHPGGLGDVWEIDRDALAGIAFGEQERAQSRCFLSLRNKPNAGGYPHASQPDSKKQPAPVEAMRPREADSSRDSSRALMAVSARRSSSALDTGDVDHHGTAQQGWLTYIRIAQFSLQCGRRDCRCSLVDRPFARSRTVSARLLGLAIPNTLPSSPLSPNYRQPTSVAHGRTTATTGFEKQRPSAFSRRGPSFWPLDRCQPSQICCSLLTPRCSLATASLLGARLLTTLDQAGVQQEHTCS
jgi:hypothetical protein